MNLDWLDHLKDLLGDHGITLVVVLAAAKRRKGEPDRPTVHAHVGEQVEFEADTDESARVLVSALRERHITVDWSGETCDRIRMR